MVFGFILVAAFVGFGYWFVLNRTRFGFDLRATGASETAAVASGVNVKRMRSYSMLLSGAVAGLVGMPQLLGSSYSYGLDFPTGLGFTGIAIALLGRNSPIGIAFGALLWSFLDNSSNSLEFEGVPKQIVLIMQGVIVLLRRHRLRVRPPLPHPAVARTSAASSPMTVRHGRRGVGMSSDRLDRDRGRARAREHARRRVFGGCSTSPRCCSCCSPSCASSPESAT